MISTLLIQWWKFAFAGIQIATIAMVAVMWIDQPSSEKGAGQPLYIASTAPTRIGEEHCLPAIYGQFSALPSFQTLTDSAPGPLSATGGLIRSAPRGPGVKRSKALREASEGSDIVPSAHATVAPPQSGSARVDPQPGLQLGTKLSTPPTSPTVPLEISKSDSPLDYSQANRATPDVVVQWSSRESLPARAWSDAHVFTAKVNADGHVVLSDKSRSGGISSSIWRGLLSTMSKSGDGSGHSFSGVGSLGPTGAVGYNELGLYIGTGTNLGSWRGTVHGSELLVRDGTSAIVTQGGTRGADVSTITLAPNASPVDGTYTDLSIEIVAGSGAGQFRRIRNYAGATRTATVAQNWSIVPDDTSQYRIINAFDTYLANHIARNARYFGGIRNSYSFLASAEGRIENTAILYGVNSGKAANGWKYGIDFRDLTFGTSAIALKNNQSIGWQLRDNSSVANVLVVDQDEHLVLKTPGLSRKLEIKSADGSLLAVFDAAQSQENPFYAVFQGTLRQVVVGEEGSGGAGFRILRVRN